MDRLKEKPYIGVTGITNATEATAVTQTFVEEGLTDLQSKHRGMVGILVSEKSLNPHTKEKVKYPTLNQIQQIFEITRGKAFNTLHYHTYQESHLAEQLKKLLDQFGFYSNQLCDGIQLNLRWPPVDEVEKTKAAFPDLRIILQIGPKILGPEVLAEKSPQEIISNLAPYVPLIDYALIDPSGGQGKVFQINTIAPIHNRIKNIYPDLPLGFAGGFNTRNIRTRLWILAQTVGTIDFSIDAEGGLRTPSKHGRPTSLSINKTQGYTHKAALFFRTKWKTSESLT
ncbi:MAG: hypothetical protein NUV73_03945 [Candidatus Daviesbacteria bacterium]|nr:hypothetical protein [Candidatus Daviesbacteria bacterium]